MTPYFSQDGITLYHGDCREWASQWKNPAAKWWHVVDIRRDTIVAESDCRSYGAPDRKATK